MPKNKNTTKQDQGPCIICRYVYGNKDDPRSQSYLLSSLLQYADIYTLDYMMFNNKNILYWDIRAASCIN